MINTVGDVSDMQTQGKRTFCNVPGIGLCGGRGNISGRCDPLQGEHIRNLSGMENRRNLTWVYLQEVERGADERRSIFLDPFGNMDKLTHLDIIGLKIEDASPISQMPELNTISLVGTD